MAVWLLLGTYDLHGHMALTGAISAYKGAMGLWGHWTYMSLIGTMWPSCKSLIALVGAIWLHRGLMDTRRLQEPPRRARASSEALEPAEIP